MQTSIAIDAFTRDRAAKRAQEELLSLAAVVRILLNEYADGRLSIGVRSGSGVEAEEIAVDARTQKKMDKVAVQWRARMKV